MSEPKQPESPVDAMPEKFYLTTPIYYVNARPHIGHAYSTIVADVLARRRRLLGHDTFFLTGTDEHGQKIERSAAAAGIPPQQFADQVSKTFSDLWQRMGITNDAFIRTTDPRHKRGVQQLFQTLYDQGHIYLSTYTGQYSIGEEMFVDGPPGTLGPDGRPTETVTEENFFFRLSAFQQPLLDLIESNALKITPESSRNEVLSFLRGNVADTFHHAHFTAVWDSDAEVSKEEALKLALELGLLRYSAPSESSPTGLLYVPGALKDLSVSRSSFTWGIPVPEAVQRHAGTTQKHVIYVWLDALANYMTAIGYGSDSSADREQFEKYWPANLHLVGKEITRFHCVYWPAFLLAAGLPTPKQITANGWLLFDNAKMSKSKGNVVRTETILDAFGEHVYKKQFPDSTKAEQDLFAADVLRYFLLREIPFGQDGTFSFEAMITRYNADLANGYGNLVSRILRMIHNDDGGVWPPTTQAQALDKSKMPEWWAQHPYSTIARFADDETSLNQPLGVEGSTGVRMILTLSGRGESGVGLDGNANVYGGRCFYAQAAYSVSDVFQVSVDPLLRAAKSVDDDLDFFKFLQLLSQHIRIVDVFLSETRPWKRQSIDPRRTEIIVAAAEYVRIITAILYPLLPYATARVWQQLGLGDIEAAAKAGDLKNLQWGGLKPGEKLGPLSPIFPRADKSLAALMEDLEASAAAKPQPEKVPAMLTTEPTPDTSQQPAAPATHPAEPLKGQGDPIPTSTPDPKDDPTNPAAPPRTASLDTENPGAQVAASYAITTGPDGTPGHTEAHASGIFAGQPDTPQIAIDDFTKIDLRVAKILVAERIPKADKLLRLEVDLGYEQRQILSGIAEHYTPEELIGRKIVIIANLAPRKMRGLESRGMLLAASEGEGGKPILATFGEDIAVGTRLR